MKFSIIIVALNPGGKLNKTLTSVFRQTYTDYEVILKDGGSSDGSAQAWKSRVRFFEEADQGIYDAMNQAVSHAAGEFILFLNCGDLLADERVLERTAAAIDRAGAGRGGKAAEAGRKMIFYGDTISEKNRVVIASAPEITGFTCYRNIPCHQSCFYSADLCREKSFDLSYSIRADYDHFLWCFYRAGAEMVHMDFPVASYEGGGFSESKENRKKDRREHKAITEKYIPGAELFRYKAYMALTLAPLRRGMAESKVFSGVYHRVKERLYSRGK